MKSKEKWNLKLINYFVGTFQKDFKDFKKFRSHNIITVNT